MTQIYDRPQVERLPLAQPAARDQGAARPGEQAAPSQTYYDQPMIKEPVWKCSIPLYFWMGGVAGGAAVAGAAARLFGGPGHRDTVRQARWLALALAALCPIPLIQDLGRPARFLNMLRIAKVSSPLNLGTWILTGFGLTSGALAARQAAEDSFLIAREGALGRALRVIPDAPLTVAHGALGVALGGYTGVLLTSSAVPLWAARGVALGPLFESTAVASGAAAVSLIGEASDQANPKSRASLDWIQTAAQFGQVVALTIFETGKPKRIARPLREGRWGRAYQAGVMGAGVVIPLALRLGARALGPRRFRWLSVTAAALTLTGALVERFALVEAGKLSARDPLAYQALTSGDDRQITAAPDPRWEPTQAPAGAGYGPGVAVSDHPE
jgi:formate-dependent nitrite reductase membrane component NrfD